MNRNGNGTGLEKYTLAEILVAAGAPQSGLLEQCQAITDCDFPSSPRLTTQPAHIDALMICIGTEGELEVSYNLHNYTLRRGSLFVCGPQSILQIPQSSNFKGHVLIISIELLRQINIDIKRFMPIMLRHNSRTTIRITDGEIAELERFISFIAYELANGDGTYTRDVVSQLIVATFYKLADTAQRHINDNSDEEHSKPNRSEEYFRRFIELLTENYKSERGVAFYAKQLCITPKYLTTLIKRVSNRSVSEWIDIFVIIEAKTMLRYSTMSVQEIAYRLNFTNQSFFGSYFKRITGMSPSQYKAQE